MRNVVIHQKKLLLEDFFKVEEATFSLEKADGQAGVPMRRLVLDRGDSVAAVVVDVEREILLLAKQFRYPTLAKGPGWLTELVAGIVNGTEDPEQAIRREILEEIGYRVSPPGAGLNILPLPGCVFRASILVLR
jgi:8-oxo-dGTP pyrophosphatase MutT (NUDIX family)